MEQIKITIESCGYVRQVFLPEDALFEQFCTELFNLAAATYGWGTRRVLEDMITHLEARLDDERDP